MEKGRGRGAVLGGGGSLEVFGFRGGNGQKGGSLMGGPAARLALHFLRQFCRPFGHFSVDLSIPVAKKLASRPTEHRLTRQGGMKARLTIKTLVTADFRSAVSAEQVSDFILG